ncbi:hypothetical protein QR66_05185 [Chromobacterium piscinae]|nr:hypothetical protein QR66_05185 [Chromobacterium piscinae]
MSFDMPFDIERLAASLPIFSVPIGAQARRVVAANALHAVLGISKPLIPWVQRVIVHCGLERHRDFELPWEGADNVPWLTLDAARIVAMATGSEVRQQVRDFLEEADHRY